MASDPLGEPCAIHSDRPSVGRCTRCQRTVCLQCAIPFRGEVLCETCAARELGDPAPEPEPARWRPASRHLAAGLAVVATVATVPPWHRSGTLTSPLSAWNPAVEAAATVASASAVLAAILSLALLAVPRARRSLAAAAAVLAAAAFVVGGVMVVQTPDFFAFTAAPYVFLAAAAVTAVLHVRVARRR